MPFRRAGLPDGGQEPDAGIPLGVGEPHLADERVQVPRGGFRYCLQSLVLGVEGGQNVCEELLVALGGHGASPIMPRGSVAS